MQQRAARCRQERVSSSYWDGQSVKAERRRGDPRIGKIIDVLGKDVARVPLRFENRRKGLRPLSIGDEGHRRDPIRAFHQDSVPLKLFDSNVALATCSSNCCLGLKERQRELRARPLALRLGEGNWSAISVEQWKWYGQSDGGQQSRNPGITPFYTRLDTEWREQTSPLRPHGKVRRRERLPGGRDGERSIWDAVGRREWRQ